MASDTKANTWFTGSTASGDTEVANIWWKLYTWVNSDSACGTWYHVPSDAEWETLETTLNGWTNCRNSQDYWLCDWLWWKLHSTTNSGTSMVEKLKFPLAGSRHYQVLSFNSRWHSIYLWSSTPYFDNDKAYYRRLGSSSSEVFRLYIWKESWFSVRCIKD